MSNFTKGQLFRVVGNNPANPADEHCFPEGELVKFLEIDRDGDYAFESVRTRKIQCILPTDVVSVYDCAASLLTKLETMTTEIAALRAQLDAMAAATPTEAAAESVERQKHRPVTQKDVRVGAQFRVAFEPDGMQHSLLDIGEIVEILKDDKDGCPKVRRLIDGDWAYCKLDRLAHIEKPEPKVGDLFRVLRDGRIEAEGCWFNYDAGTIVELISEDGSNFESDGASAHFRQVGGTPGQRPDYDQIIWFVDLEPYSGPVPATEISQDATRQMLDTLKELVSKAEAVVAKVEGRE